MSKLGLRGHENTQNSLLLGAISLATFAGSKSDPVNHDRSGIAIQGYDSVGYFTDSKPIKALLSLPTLWNGANWHFTSAEHRDLIAKDPDRYAPRYGGHCTYGVKQEPCRRYRPTALQSWTRITRLAPGLRLRRRFLAFGKRYRTDEAAKLGDGHFSLRHRNAPSSP